MVLVLWSAGGWKETSRDWYIFGEGLTSTLSRTHDLIFQFCVELLSLAPRSIDA